MSFKKENPDETYLKEHILSLFKKFKKPLLLREIYHFLNVSSSTKPLIKKLINQLVEEQKLVSLKKRKFFIPEKDLVYKGRLRVYPGKFGFVKTEEGKTIFIPPRKIKQGLDGDIVLVKVYKTSSKGPEGTIVKVLERKHKNIVGYLVKRKELYLVEPEDPKFPFEIYIPKKRKHKAKVGNLVVTKIIEPTSEFGLPIGEVVKDLGDPTFLESHCLAVIYKLDLPHEFGLKVEKELTRLPDEVLLKNKKGRKDLTQIPLVTIDGENARDFDDAICVKKTPKGFKLWVAIADVSYYVSKDSNLDKEAYLRGTSVYFPNMVIPMFPEKLSNHLCSLNPLVERLAMVVEMEFNNSGNLLDRKFYEAVIKSHARLTYTEVKRMFVDKEKEILKKYKPLVPMLEEALELASLLRNKRLKRGSLDFDLPEAEVIVSQGEIENIIKRERNIAHMLIEDFMITTNESVAEYLTERGYPFLYRIHEEPDFNKLRELIEIFLSLGIEIEFPKEISPKVYQEIIFTFKDTPSAYLFNTFLLRSLKQAKYSPHNVGHFGLASTCYCHFTSPIRRYSDLVVHRTLKRALKNKKPPYTEEELEVMGKYLSERERQAEEAEREILKKFQAIFMKDKVGQVFSGIITGITAFGFFVDLEEYLVSGVVKLAELVDDYYVLDKQGISLIGKKTGKVFQIGQRVKVKVKEVDLRYAYINFALIEIETNHSLSRNTFSKGS